jgi:hypothetical protein
MSRTLHALRAAITVGAVLTAFGAHAADAQVQRLAMARTHGSDAAATVRAAHPVASTKRAEMTVAKATARRTQQRQDTRDSDGSRFTYDSCGCSN